MKVQNLIIADLADWVNDYAKNISLFEFRDEKAIFIVDDLPKSAYNEMRDIALENEFKCDIVHNSIILY